MNSAIAYFIAKFESLQGFVVFVGKNFLADSGVRIASALSYTTLLSLVPLMAVMFSTLAAFPAFNGMEKDIESFVFRNFVPAWGETVQTYLQEFSAKASGLRAVGLIFLFITVLSMMNTIEGAFNNIWNVRITRKPATRFMIYWAVLTLGPVLIGAGFVATSYLISSSIFSAVDSTFGLKRRLLTFMPLVTTTLAFFLIYRLLPYRTVSTRSAFLGGLIAGILFELAKRLFAVYVVNFPSQQAIYGAFATIPLFLLWIYLSWIIILLGAEITHCHMIYQRYARRKNTRDRSLFVDAFRVTNHLWKAQINGKPLTVSDLLERELSMIDERMYEVLRILCDASWIQRTASGAWVLLRDPGEETLLSLYLTLPGGLPLSADELCRDDELNERFYSELGKGFESLKLSMKTSLKILYES